MSRPFQDDRTARVWDANFKGHGVILCNACNKPLRDHEISEPCPELKLRPGELTVGKVGKNMTGRHTNEAKAKKEKRT